MKLKLPKRAYILQYMGGFSMLLAVYPVTAVVDAMLGHPPLYGVLHAILLALTGLCGCFCHSLAARYATYRIVRFLLLSVASLLFAGIAVVFLLGAPWYELLFSCIAEIFLFFIGIRATGENYAEYGRFSQLAGLAIGYGVGVFACWMLQKRFPLQYDPVAFALLFLLAVTLLCLVRNQANIDLLTVSRHYPLEALPEKIRVRNLVLLGFLLLVVLLGFWLFVGQGPVLLHWLSEGWKWLIHLLRTLFSEDALKQGTQQLESGMKPGPEELGEIEPGNLWLGLVVKIIIWGIVILGTGALFYYNRQSILRFFRETFHMLAQWVRSLFEWVLGNGRMESNEEYSDSSETVDVGQGSGKRLNAGQARRGWSRAYKKYRRMEDTPQKFKTGYLLAWRGIHLCGIPVSQSDTLLEVAGKSISIAGSEYAGVTDIYDEAFYGETSTGFQDYNELDVALLKIANYLQKRGK